jgi:hypothetical protein
MFIMLQNEFDTMYNSDIICTMSIATGGKLQKLVTSFPKGVPFTVDLLKAQGYSSQLLARYKKSGWIEPFGNGAYRLHGDTVDWRGGLAALQQQLKLDVHCGARTALELQGYGHYAALTPRTVYLFGSPGQKLPRWFQEYDWQAKVMYKATSFLPCALDGTYVDFPAGNFLIRVSAPERAAMEMLYYVPTEQGFDEAERIMESLLTLRPTLVQNLLEVCKSVKVKRLFMYMAERGNLPWVDQLDLAKVDLGRGDRTVVRGGHLDPKYRITVPRSG